MLRKELCKISSSEQEIMIDECGHVIEHAEKKTNIPRREIEKLSVVPAHANIHKPEMHTRRKGKLPKCSLLCKIKYMFGSTRILH